MWYEALPPFMIIIGLMSASAMGLKFVDRLTNNGKVMIKKNQFAMANVMYCFYFNNLQIESKLQS